MTNASNRLRPFAVTLPFHFKGELLTNGDDLKVVGG